MKQRSLNTWNFIFLYIFSSFKIQPKNSEKTKKNSILIITTFRRPETNKKNTNNKKKSSLIFKEKKINIGKSQKKKNEKEMKKTIVGIT